MNTNGKPPRSASQIRSRLASISNSADVVRHAGPLNEETQADQQIVVASFFDHQLGREFQKELTRNGLFSERFVQKRKLVITVDHADAQPAISISKKFREANPDRRDPTAPTRYDYLIFGVLTGLALSTVFTVDTGLTATNISFSLAVVGIFGASGHLIDRARSSRAKFQLWDMFVLVAIVLMIISFAKAFPLLH